MVELDVPAETEEETAAREAQEAKVRDWRSRAALRAAPDLAMHIRSIAVGGNIETGETLREWTAPMRITAADDADLLYAKLVDWVSFWHRWIPNTMASPADLKAWTPAHGEVNGFVAGTTPALAQVLVRFQTGWLLGRADTIAQHHISAEYQEDVTDLIWQMRSRYPMRGHREKPVSPRPCPVCGELAVGADWFEADDRSAVKVQCEMCGHRIPVKKLRGGATDEWLPTVHVVTDPLIVSEERAQLLARPLLLPSEAAYLVGKSKSQVNRWITAGLPTYPHPRDRQKYVKLAEVRDWIETNTTRQR